MNRILLVLAISFFLFFSHCTCHKYKKNAFNIQVNVIEKLPSDQIKNKQISGNYYSVEIDLFNNTDTNVTFWLYTGPCWTRNWISNINGLVLCGEQECEGNSDFEDGHIIQIMPNEHLLYKGTIYVSESLEEKKETEVKLGLILISTKEAYNFPEFVEIMLFKKPKVIIWSEPFKIIN